MFCIYCGTKLRDGAKYCPSCGKPVKSSNKALDLAKAGAKQILEALKDHDINAPATAGELRCRTDAAQSVFMKLLKKGLLGLVSFLFISSSINATPELSRKLGPFTVENSDMTYTIEFDGARVTGDMFTGGKKHIKADGKTVQTGIHGYFDKKNNVTLKFKVLEDKGNEEWNVTVEYGRWEDIVRRRNSRETENVTKVSKPLATGNDAVFKIPVPDEESLLNIMIRITRKSDEGYINWIQGGKEFYLEYGGEFDSVHDSAADEEAGENGWLVPAAVIGVGAAIGGIALKKRRKKKSGGKKEKAAEKEKEKGKKEEKKEDDDEEKASYEMRIRKDFGDTLTPGAAAEKLFARIVRISSDGKEKTDSGLTGKIAISGDDYLRVGVQGMAGEYMSAEVEAPQEGDIPSEAVVNFRLAGAGGSFTNRMHFKIAKSEIIFFQENLTLPACSDEVWRLPFVVKGASGDSVVEACESCLKAYDVKIEAGEKDGLFYAVISEKVKDKKEPGTYEHYNLGVKVVSGAQEIADSLPLYRFHMGLRFRVPDSISCCLKPNAASGKQEVVKNVAELIYFDWDPETNDIVTVFPVPTAFKMTAPGETEQGYLDKLGITCKPTSTTTENGRQLQIYPVLGILDAPTRFNASVSLTADCGKGRAETIKKEVLITSQPVRQNVTAADLDSDRRIGDGLQRIQKSIWDNGEYNRLFPLYKLIDVMLDGYDGAYGYDRQQVDTVKDVYRRFLNGDLAGANATAESVTLADEMALFVDSFLKTSQEVENSMGFFTRMAVGVATLGVSDAVFTGLQVARDMKATAEKGGDTWDAFVAGVKVVAIEAAFDRGGEWALGKLGKAAKKYAPDQYASVTKGAAKLQDKAADYFSGFTGKKTGKVLEKSKGVRAKAASQADEAIDAFRKNPELSDLDCKLDQVYKNGQAHGKAKVEDLQAAQWLMESNPTPENIKLYKKKVLEVQRDKFAMQQLNSLPDGNSARATFNKELDSVYRDVDDEVREALRKRGYDMDDNPFAATSSNKADLEAGNKVTYDRDVTYRTRDGRDVPQSVAQEEYEKAFYKCTTGTDAPNAKVAEEWAQMHDQAIVQHGSPVSYEDDLNPVIKDWDQKLTNAEHTGKVMTYKSTEWFEQTNKMIHKANTLEDSGLRLDMLEQALSKRQEATRQMVKQFKYVHERDVAAQAAGVVSRISEKMRFGMEISSRLFASGKDALTLTQVEAILAKHNLTLELLSSQLGDTLVKIG